MDKFDKNSWHLIGWLKVKKKKKNRKHVMPEKKDNIKFWLNFRPFAVSGFIVSKKKKLLSRGWNKQWNWQQFFCWLFFIKTKKAFELRCVMHHTSERLAK